MSADRTETGEPPTFLRDAVSRPPLGRLDRRKARGKPVRMSAGLRLLFGASGAARAAGKEHWESEYRIETRCLPARKKPGVKEQYRK